MCIPACMSRGKHKSGNSITIGNLLGSTAWYQQTVTVFLLEKQMVPLE